MFDVITIGSVTRDVFLKSGDFKIVKNERLRTGKAGCFMLGTKFEVEEAAITVGGGSVNTAIGFGRQRLKTGCMGRIGDDDIGREIIEELKRERVEPLLQVDEKNQTAYSTILVADNGERTILEYRGANNFFERDKVDWSSLKTKWIYVDSLAGDMELLKDVMDYAKNNGVKIAFNPGKRVVKRGKELWPFMERVDIFTANEDESAYIAGLEYGEDKEAEIFAKLDEIVKGVVIMTKGPRGLEISDGKTHYKAGVPDAPVIDRTGSGDSFGSGFVSGYIESDGDIKYAVQLGTANATSVVQFFGGTKGLLKKGEWGDYPKIEVEVIEK